MTRAEQDALQELRDAQDCLFAVANVLVMSKNTGDPIAKQAAALAIQIQDMIDSLKKRQPS